MPKHYYRYIIFGVTVLLMMGPVAAEDKERDLDLTLPDTTERKLEEIDSFKPIGKKGWQLEAGQMVEENPAKRDYPNEQSLEEDTSGIRLRLPRRRYK